MPDKSRRVASRQAELRRRRVGRMRTGATPSTVLNEPLRVSGPIAATPQPNGSSAASSAAAPRSREQTAPHAMVYDYVGRELLRIGVVSAVVVALLIAATIVLK